MAANENRGVDDAAVEFLVYDFLRYRLGKHGYDLSLPENRLCPPRTLQVEVCTALRQIADQFVSQYRDEIIELSSRIVVTSDIVNDAIEGVGNELFIEGIKWTRIVSFFVFGSELAVQCVDRCCYGVIDDLAQAISNYVKTSLLPWINSHGGWSGLVQFMEEGRNVEGQTGGQNRWPSVKHLLCIGMTAVGAITLGAFLSRS